jgi:polyisoprenoid-binding protein YceI
MMRNSVTAMVLTASVVLGLGMAAGGDDYTMDTAHSGVTFKITHSDLNWIYGRFNRFTGDFAIDPADPAKSSFTMTIAPESVDTNNAKRDNHLRSPDFFNTKQYPSMKFASTSVKPIEGGFEVTGDLNLHGQTKPLTFNLTGGKTISAKGGQRTGYTAEFKLKRSDFGITKFSPMLGDDVWVTVSFQGTKKR